MLRGLCLLWAAAAGWFPKGFLPAWTGADSPETDENMRTDPKSSLLQTGDASADASADASGDAAQGDEVEDLSEQLQGLSNEVEAANDQDKAESESLKTAATQALANLDSLQLDVDGAMNKTVSGKQAITQASTAIKNSATKARQAVQAVVDLDKSATQEMSQHSELLTEKASNAALAIDAKGNTYLQKMKGDFDVNYLTADQGISRDLTDIASAVNKVQQTSNANMDKADVKAQMLSDKLAGMTRKLSDTNSDLSPKIKELMNLMKGDTKASQKEYDSLFKQVKKEISDLKPVDEKVALKAIKNAKGDLEDGAEDAIGSAEDKMEDLVKESEKSLKKTQKHAEKTAKDMMRNAESTAIDREKKIKGILKSVDSAILDSKKTEDRIKVDIIDAVEGHTRDMAGRISEKATQVAVDQSTMFKRTSENAEKAIQSVQVSADAAAAKMNSDNGRDAADAASSSYKVVQSIDEEAQSVSMGINNKIGGVTSSVSTAKNAVAGAADALADVQAEIEAASLSVKSQQEKAAGLTTRSTQAMANDVQQLDLDMKIKMDSAQTDLRNEKDAFAAKSSSVKQALEMPITQKAEGVNRELESAMNQMAIKVNEQMGQLKGELKNVKAGMQAIGVNPDAEVPQESKVLGLVQKTMREMDAFERAKLGLKRDVENTPALVESNTMMKAKELNSQARKAQQVIVKSQMEQIRKTEAEVFRTLGTQGKKMDQLKGRTVASSDRDEQQSEYIEKRVSALVDEMGKFKTEHDEVSNQLRSKTGTFTDQLMPEFVQKATAAAEGVQESASRALTTGEENLNLVLHGDRAKMDEDAAARAAYTQKELKDEEDRILRGFSAGNSHEAEQMNHLYAASEALKFEAKNATETLQEEQDRATDAGTKADESAQMIEAKVKSQTEQTAESSHDMDDMITKMTQESIDYAKRQADAEIHSKGQEMDEAVAKLGQKANGISSSADLVVKGAMSDFDTLGRKAKEQLNGIKAKTEFSDKDQQSFAGNLESRLVEEGDKETEEGEDVERSLESDERKFGGAETRNNELVKVMEEDAKDVRQEADDKLSEVEAKVDANTQAMAGKIDASFDAAKMAATTAHDSLQASKIDLQAARQNLLRQMGGVQAELNHKANETGQAILMFEKSIEIEKEMLDKNEAYLNAYDLQTQSQVLQVLQNVENTISGAADTAAGGFKEVEDAEKAIGVKMDEQMGSSAFSALQKIMDADNYAQQAALENRELVSYVGEFKTDQETFMDALIKAMYDAQYAVILHENEEKLEQAAMDADSNALTDNVIGKLTGLVDGNGTDGEANELEGMTEGTLKMLLAKAASGSESDKAQIALLMKKISANGMGKLAHLKNAQAFVDAINSAVSGNAGYGAMKADLQHVVEFNQKMVDEERKRMEKRGVQLSDKLFFGGADISAMKTPEGFKHVKLSDRQAYQNQAVLKVQESYKRDALLEQERTSVDASTAAARKVLEQAKLQWHATQSPKLEEHKRWHARQSLLEENEKLMAENQQLAQEHAHIGHAIREAVTKLKSGPPRGMSTAL